jgi:hypothetical protein
LWSCTGVIPDASVVWEIIISHNSTNRFFHCFLL